MKRVLFVVAAMAFILVLRLLIPDSRIVNGVTGKRSEHHCIMNGQAHCGCNAKDCSVPCTDCCGPGGQQACWPTSAR